MEMEELIKAFKGNNWKRAANKQAFELMDVYLDVYGDQAKEVIINDFGLNVASKIVDMAWFYSKYEAA